MQVLFCRSNAIGSRLIRLLTWSDWSHVALVDGDRYVEATWPRVRESTLAEILAAHTEHQVVEIPCRDPQAALKWARAQVGLPYDLGALLGFLVHRDWTKPWRWFCSELVAEAFEEGGSPLFRANTIGRVTPQLLWMLAPGPGGTPQT